MTSPRPDWPLRFVVIVGALVCLWTVWIILWTRALSGPSVEGPIAVTQSGRDGSVTRVVEAGTGDAEP